MFTIYSADVTGNPGNCSYPHKHVILDEASLKDGICHDYVCAEYRNNYRNGDNFIGSDCLPVEDAGRRHGGFPRRDLRHPLQPLQYAGEKRKTR